MMGSFGNSPNIARKFKIRQIMQKLFAEQLPATQVLDVLRLEAQLLDVLDDLLQTSCDGESTAIRTTTVEQIEICDPVLVTMLEISMCHG